MRGLSHELRDQPMKQDCEQGELEFACQGFSAQGFSCAWRARKEEPSTWMQPLLFKKITLPSFYNDLTQFVGEVIRQNQVVERCCRIPCAQDTREIAARFDEIIAFAELERFVDTPYKHLSSGMKVRLAFSVISRLEEPILLVDEVLAVGDKPFCDKCYRRIDELLAGGRTLFFVSHNERDLKRFCTRGLYLDGGTLKLDAPIAEVLAAYNREHGEGA